MLIVLYLCWIIFNGNITLEIALVGVFVTGLIYAFMCKFLNWSLKREFLIFRFAVFGLQYICILIIEIIKATAATIGMAFNSKEEICPVVVSFDVNLEAEVFRVLLANSITMTPGTITVSLEGGHYTVHALDENFAVDIDKSIFVEKLTQADDLYKKFKEGK